MRLEFGVEHVHCSVIIDGRVCSNQRCVYFTQNRKQCIVDGLFEDIQCVCIY